MLMVSCPHCGARDESEFVCVGEPRLRPDAVLDERAWSDALYTRANLKGLAEELWFHKHGCRQWFRLTRDTSTGRFAR
jgi:sarcosine oxidase subunit delta